MLNLERRCLPCPDLGSLPNASMHGGSAGTGVQPLQPAMPPTVAGPLGALPSRLQDLPVETLLYCIDFMDPASRLAFGEAEPRLGFVRRSAETVRAVRQATTAREVSGHLALARQSSTPESMTECLAVMQRANALLDRLCQERIQAELRDFRRPPGSPPQADAHLARTRPEMLALELLLRDCVEGAQKLYWPQKTRLSCGCLKYMSFCFDTLEEGEPGIGARLLSQVLDGVLHAAQAGSSRALRTVAHVSGGVAEMVRSAYDPASEDDRQTQQRTRAERVVEILAGDGLPCRDDETRVAALARLVHTYLPDRAALHAPRLLQLLDVSGGSRFMKACEETIEVFRYVEDPDLQRQLVDTLLRGVGRAVSRWDEIGKHYSFRIYCMALALLAELPPADAAQLSADVEEAGRRIAALG